MQAESAGFSGPGFLVPGFLVPGFLAPDGFVICCQGGCLRWIYLQSLPEEHLPSQSYRALSGGHLGPMVPYLP